MIALLRDEVNIKSFQTQQKYIDKVFKREYDVFKRNGSEVRKDMTGYRESIEKKREDAKEMIEILEKIPRERKPEALALVKGFALCAELDEKKVG